MYGWAVILYLLYLRRDMLREDKDLAATLSVRVPERLTIHIYLNIRFSLPF
jgi:hypothetical protein